ncbi:MAG: hypothetical protein Q8K92_21930, partial [Leadbetterella sp.]|nr:hypothetical protein [Leadbetterella sp.]
MTHTKNLEILQDLLGSQLPDWKGLQHTAEEIVKSNGPDGTTLHLSSELSIAKKHLKKGIKHNVFGQDGLIVIQPHPSTLEKILLMIASFFSVFLQPWYAIRNTAANFIQSMAEKLGGMFAVLALPVAFIAFLGDIVTMLLEFIVSVPALILSPLTLIRSFFGLLFQFVARLLARVIWAFLLPVIGKLLFWLQSGNGTDLQGLLKKRPWLRYLILGFLRSERPTKSYTIIPGKTVTQILTTKKGGIFNRGEYLIVVEGEKLERGFLNRIKSWVKMMIFPFYWERTVHMLHLPKDNGKRQELINTFSCSL